MDITNKKILIASGCSFTFEDWCWPGHLSKELNINLLNVGMSCQGNGLISKKLIHTVDEQLKIRNPEDILVGVMWSGIDRHDIYIDEYYEPFSNIDGWWENPTNIIDGRKNWLILNQHWKTKISSLWYKNFHTVIGSMIYSIQDVLLVQWYLEKHNIKYFMTTYMDIFHRSSDTINHPEVKYLFNMINFDTFIPIIGCYEWIKENHNDDGFDKVKQTDPSPFHPNSCGHNLFSTEVIIPHLKTKNLI
jgi:hypothetical protein